MNRRNFKQCIIVIACILIFATPFQSKALIVGSNTLLSREEFAQFPAAGTDNTILGFAWLNNGFELEDATTSCTFDSVYPVSGTINLNGGTLYLSQDLILNNPVDLQGFGTIVGNNHKLVVCSSITELPADTQLFIDTHLYIPGDIDLLSTVSFRGNCLITTNGNIIDLSAGGQIIVDSNSRLELQNVRIEGIGNNNIRCADDTSHLILDNVMWCQLGDITFSYGDLLIQNLVSFIGSSTFTYDSAMTSTIDDQSMWRFDGGMKLCLGRKNQVIEPLYFVNENSVVVLGECSMITTSSGLTLTRGRLEFEKNVFVETQLTGSQYGTILGDGVNPENDFTIYCDAGCNVVFRGGWLTYNNVRNDRFYAASPSSRFTRMGPSYFYIKRDCIFPECILNFAITNQFPPTIVVPGVKLYYDKTKVVISGSEGIVDGYRTSDTAVVLGGNDSLNIQSGQFLPPLVVAGVNNSLIGSGSISGAINFLDSSTKLLIALQGGIDNAVNLNGGTLTLGGNLSFSRDFSFLTAGTINLSNNVLSFGLQPFSSNVLLYWKGTDGEIEFRSDLTLSNVWTLSGTVMIQGNGNTLNLGVGGALLLAPDSTITLKNIHIKGIDGSNIQCSDDTSTLILDSVSWIQDGNFTYSYGSLEIKNLVHMQGEGTTFAYCSPQTCLINEQSTLLLDYDVTFSYDPSSGDSKLISLADKNSIINLYKATFFIPATGLELIGGQFIIEQDSNLYCATTDNDGNESNVGITFGDGISDHECYLVFRNGAQLNLLNGALNYRNSERSESLQMTIGSGITVNSEGTLRLYENMHLGKGSVAFAADARLMQALGKQIFGSVYAQGTFLMGDL